MAIRTGDGVVGIEQQVLEVVKAVQGPLPDHWLLGDDKCDCVHQRIGEWTNPYTARTLQIRLCCVWKALGEMFPGFIQEVDAFYDDNLDEWVEEPRAWDSEDADMPVYLWFRQLARQTGRPLPDIRQEYRKRTRERPRRVPKGRGRESRVEPSMSDERVKVAHARRLRQSGWVVD